MIIPFSLLTAIKMILSLCIIDRIYFTGVQRTINNNGHTFRLPLNVPRVRHISHYSRIHGKTDRSVSLVMSVDRDGYPINYSQYFYRDHPPFSLSLSLSYLYNISENVDKIARYLRTFVSFENKKNDDRKEN